MVPKTEISIIWSFTHAWLKYFFLYADARSSILEYTGLGCCPRKSGACQRELMCLEKQIEHKIHVELKHHILFSWENVIELLELILFPFFYSQGNDLHDILFEWGVMYALDNWNLLEGYSFLFTVHVLLYEILCLKCKIYSLGI